MWQTYTHLALFYLSEQQQHAQRQQLLGSQALLELPADVVPAEPAKSDNVVTSSLSGMYSSALLDNLTRLSRAPPRIHFHNEDGLLRETHDAATMMLHLAQLKQPALTAAQLVLLVQLAPFAPPHTQHMAVQLIGYEVAKVTPKEFERQLQETSIAGPSASTSVTSVSSAAAFTSSLLSYLSAVIVRTSALSSLGAVSSLFASRQHRSSDSLKEATESKQAPWVTSIDLNEEAWRRGMHSVSSAAGKRSRERGSASEFPTFASPETVLSSSASSSTYQEWRSGEEQQFNPAQLAVLEELVLVLRSLCHDRAWRRLAIPQLVQPVLTLPAALDTLRRALSSSSTPLSLTLAFSAGCASFAVLGGWNFVLRRGAYVEVNMQGDFAAEAAAPASTSLLSSTAASIHRGFVQSVDFDAHTATVLTSPSRPRFPTSQYRGDGASSHVASADLTCDTFSFAQLRCIPSVPPPNLNDQAAFATMWSALSAVLEVPAEADRASTSDRSFSAASTGVIHLVQAHTQRLALGLVQSQAVLAARQQAAAKLSIDTRPMPRQPFDNSLGQPVSPSFDELLSSPVVEPLTLSPLPPATEAASDSTLTCPPHFSLASDNDANADVTWTLQPVQSSSLTSVSPPVKSSLRNDVTSQRSPATSPEPPPPRQRVDYSVFVNGAIQLARLESPNHLFSLSPFGVDIARRHLSHRLSSVLSLDVQRRQRLSSLATRLSRVVSRATSRAITRSVSLHASGTVTPVSHNDVQQQEQQGANAVPPITTLSAFPLPTVSDLTTSLSSRRQIFIPVDGESAASSVQATPREEALPGWSAITSPSVSPSSLPHFIRDPSDPLQTPVWSPTPRLDQIIHRLQAQLPAASAAAESQGFEHEQQTDDNDRSEPDSPSDHADTREMNVHDEDEQSVDHTDTMFATHDRHYGVQPASDPEDDDYGSDAFDDDQLDAMLDQQPPSLSSPADIVPSLLPSAPTDHVIFHYLYGLVSIGYPDHCARFALARCGGNLHAALEFLLSGEITLHDEYTHVGGAMMAFQHLLYRLGLVSRDVTGGQAADAAANSAPLMYRHIAIAQSSDRDLLFTAIRHLSELQGSDLSDFALYDWVDARDSYGKRFLAQVVRRTSDPPSVTVHFMAWQDQFNENIMLPSDRLQLVTPALIEQTRLRLEGERSLNKVKVYGPAVHKWLTAERAKLAALSSDALTWLPSSIHMADPYSFPVSRPPARIDPLIPSATATAELLGARVYVTPECISLLHASLCLPAVDVASEYVAGNKLLVVDTVGKLCEAEITEVRGTEIRIHYPGWGGKWDETLSVHSPRIQGRQGSNKRRVREGNVMPGSDSAKQLYELVGSTGVIVEVIRGCKLEGGEKGRGRADKSDDALVRVEVLDDHRGTVVTFRTRLALLKRLELGDTPRLSQSALLAMSRFQLLQENRRSEQSAVALQAGQLLQTLTQLTLPQPATDVRRFSLYQLLDSLAITRQLTTPQFEVARTGWADSVLGQVGESCFVVPARHMRPWTQCSERDAPAPPEGTELNLDSHHHPLVFRSLSSSRQSPLQWRVCAVCSNPRAGPMFECTECSYQQCLPCNVQALPFAHSAPPSSHMSSARAKVDSQREVADDRATQWLDTTAYRARCRGGDRVSLQVLDALSRQMLEPMPPASGTSVRWLPPETLIRLDGEAEHVIDVMTKAMDSVCGQQQAESKDNVLSGADLSDSVRVELKAGQRARLHIDNPDIDSILVAWVRTSQPNFDMQFYHCATPDDSPSADTSRASAPGAAAASRRVVSGQRDAGRLTEESIQLAEDASRPLASDQADGQSFGMFTSAVRLNSRVCQSVESMPPALARVHDVPPLKSPGVPLLLPNPCYVSVGGVRRGKDEIADVSDDELQVVVTPVKGTSWDSIALWIELVLHLRREWMCVVSDDSAESIASEVLLPLRHSHQQFCRLLISLLRAVRRCYLKLRNSCAWPSAVGSRCLELIAHLSLSIVEVLNLPNSHPLFTGIDALKDVVKAEDAQLEAWQRCLQSMTEEQTMRLLAELPTAPLHSAYLHRLSECITAERLYFATSSVLAAHQVVHQYQVRAHAIHTRGRERSCAEPTAACLELVSSAPWLYEQSGHTADCPCQYCQTVASKTYRAS